MRVRLRAAAMLAVGTFGLVGLSAPAADAVAAHPAPSPFVGSYALHGTITGTGQHLAGTFNVHANGTMTDQRGRVAQWKSAGTTITIFYNKFVSEKFVGKLSPTGISSAAHPGTFTTNVAGLSGTWYAIRIR